MSFELSDFIRQMDSGREITSDDVPELALLIANELAALVRLSGLTQNPKTRTAIS